MSLEGLIDRICRFPESGAAMSGILEAYRRAEKPISAEALERYLRLHPDLVDSWVLYSENQRCHPSWYLLQRDRDSAFEVGMPKRFPVYEFRDGFSATAFFLKCLFDKAYSPGCFLFFWAPTPKPSMELLAYLNSRRGTIRAS